MPPEQPRKLQVHYINKRHATSFQVRTFIKQVDGFGETVVRGDFPLEPDARAFLAKLEEPS
jgi:hypothetical protein